MLADAELMIKLDIAGSGEKWMGVLRDMGDQRDFVIGEAGEELEMLDPSIVQNMEVINLPGQVAVEYWGSCALVEVQDLLAAAGVEAHGWEHDVPSNAPPADHQRRALEVAQILLQKRFDFGFGRGHESARRTRFVVAWSSELADHAEGNRAMCAKRNWRRRGLVVLLMAGSLAVGWLVLRLASGGAGSDAGSRAGDGALADASGSAALASAAPSASAAPAHAHSPVMYAQVVSELASVPGHLAGPLPRSLAEFSRFWRSEAGFRSRRVVEDLACAGHPRLLEELEHAALAAAQAGASAPVRGPGGCWPRPTWTGCAP
jgi:hypothetical protein